MYNLEFMYLYIYYTYTHTHEHTLYCIVHSSIMYNYYYYYYTVYCIYHIYIEQQQEILFVYMIERGITMSAKCSNNCRIIA